MEWTETMGKTDEPVVACGVMMCGDTIPLSLQLTLASARSLRVKWNSGVKRVELLILDRDAESGWRTLFLNLDNTKWLDFDRELGEEGPTR